MKTRRHRTLRRKKNRKMTYKNKAGRKWTTAIEEAQKTLGKTGSVQAARESLRKQALTNARLLFGSVGSM